MIVRLDVPRPKGKICVCWVRLATAPLVFCNDSDHWIHSRESVIRQQGEKLSAINTRARHFITSSPVKLDNPSGEPFDELSQILQVVYADHDSLHRKMAIIQKTLSTICFFEEHGKRCIENHPGKQEMWCDLCRVLDLIAD